MSQDLLASKVAIFEEEPRVRGIPSAPTSVAGAVGITAKGPVGKAVLCTSFDEYLANFGAFTANSDLTVAVKGFFENGGNQLWVSRVASTGGATASANLLANSVAAPTPATATASIPAPFELLDGHLLTIQVGADTYSLTFNGTPAEVRDPSGTPRTEPFRLSNGQTLQVAVDGGAPQTVTFSSGPGFLDISAATAQEVADAINAGLTGAEAITAAGTVRIRTISGGTASTLVVTGGTAVSSIPLPATITGSTAAPFTMLEGDPLVVQVGPDTYTLTFEAFPATLKDTADVPMAGPYVLADGMTLQISVNGGAPQTITFSTPSFTNIAAATAQEVVDAINLTLNGAQASLEGGAFKVQTIRRGTSATLQVTGGTAVSGSSAPATLVGTTPAPFTLSDGDQLVIQAGAQTYTLTFNGTHAEIHDTSGTPKVEPFHLAPGLELTLDVDGTPHTATFTSGSFANIEAATAVEVANAINSAIPSVNATAVAGALHVRTVSAGSASSLSATGSAIDGVEAPAMVTGTVAPPFTLTDGDTLTVDVEPGAHHVELTFTGEAAEIVTTNGPYVILDGQTLELTVDGGAAQTVTFTSGAFADIGAATPTEVANVINTGITGVHAEVSEGQVHIATLSAGSASSIAATGGTVITDPALPATMTGTNAAPFALSDGDTLTVEPTTGTYDVTFTAAPAELADPSVTPKSEPYGLFDGETLLVSVDGGPDQTITFSAGDFGAIDAADATEVVDAINAQITGAEAVVVGTHFVIRTLSEGTASLIAATGGTAAGPDGPASTTSTNAEPFDAADGDALSVTVGANTYPITFTGEAAEVTGTLSEPFELIDGQTLLIKVDGGSAQPVTFTTADFGDISAATAAEVADAINDQLAGATATAVSGAIKLTTASEGSVSHLEVTGGTAASFEGEAPASVTGTVAPPFAITDGDPLNVTANGNAYSVTFNGEAAEIEGTPTEPFSLSNGQTLIFEVDGGGPQTVTFSSADFGNMGAATAAEVVAAINADLVGAVASSVAGAIKVTTSTAGSVSSIEVTGGTAAAAVGPAVITGSIAAPFALSNGQSISVDIDGADLPDPFAITFEGTAASILGDLPTGGTFTLSNGQTLLIAVDGGAPQTVTFTTTQFGNIAAATPFEVATAINGGLTGASAFLDSDNRIVIASNVAGSSSAIAVTGGTAAMALGPAVVTGTVAAPFSVSDGDGVSVDASGTPYAITFNGGPAEVDGTTTGPFPLADGQTLLVQVDGGSAQTVTFSAGSFGDISAATAAEVADAINAQIAGAAALAVSDAVTIATTSRGTASTLAITGGSVFAPQDPAVVTGTVAAPFTVSDGQGLTVTTNVQPYAVTFQGQPAVLQDTAMTPATEPFLLTDGQTLIVEVDGGAPQTVTFSTGGFADMSIATASEVAAVITAGLIGATASAVGGAVKITTSSRGTASSLEVTGGTAAAATSPAVVTGTVAPPFALTDGQALTVTTNVQPYTVTFNGSAAEVEGVGAGPFPLFDGQTLILTVDGGSPQTFTFTTSQFLDIANATATEVVDAINATLGGALASQTGGVIKITAASKGTASSVAVTGGTAAAGTAPAEVTGTVAPPFALTDGDTLSVQVGADTFDIDFEGDSAVVAGANTGPYALSDGDTLIVAVDGGAPQTVTFTAGEFTDISAATASELSGVLEGALVGAAGSAVGGVLRLATATKGTSASIEVTGGTARTIIGFPTGVNHGTGNVPDLGSVSATDIAALFAAVGGDAKFTVTDITTGIELATIEYGADISIQVSGTAAATLGLDTSIHHGVGENPFGLRGKSDTGGGNVAHLSAVTVAEVSSLFAAVSGDDELTETDITTGMRITSVALGTETTLQVSGTAATALGLDTSLHQGGDTDPLGLRNESASGSGNVASLSAVTVAEVASLFAAVSGDDELTVTDITTGMELTSVGLGSSVTLQVSGTAATALGLDTALHQGGDADPLGLRGASGTGTGNVTSLSAVTAAEVIALFVAASAGGAFTVADITTGIELTSVAIGSVTTLQVSGTAATALGLDTSLHTGTDTDPLGFLGASDTGSGNVTNLGAVTVAEVASLFAAVDADDYFTVTDAAPGLRLTTLAIGPDTTIQVVDTGLGSAATQLGLDLDLHTGTVVDPFGLYQKSDTGSGNVADIHAVTAAEVSGLLDAAGIATDFQVINHGTALEFATFETGTDASIQVTGAAGAAMGFDTALHQGYIGNVLGLLAAEDTGTGDVSNVHAVTITEITDLLTTAGATADIAIANVGGHLKLSTLTTGPSATFDLSGTATTPLGLSAATFVGYDGDPFGFKDQSGAGTGNVANIEAVTATEVVDLLGDAGATAGLAITVVSNRIRLTTLATGASESIDVSGTAVPVLGLDDSRTYYGVDPDPLGLASHSGTGTGNVPNLLAVTIANVASLVSLAPEGSSVVVSSVGTGIRLASSGTGTGASIQVGGAAVTALGLDTDLHVGAEGDRLGLHGQSSAGTGNVAKLSAVTFAELTALATAANAFADVHITSSLSGITIATILTGSGVQLQTTGTAAGHLGLSTTAVFGVDGDRLGLVNEHAQGSGNVANISAVTASEVADLAASTGATAGFSVNNLGTGLRLSTVPVGAYATIQVAGAAATAMGFDGNVHHGSGGDILGLAGRSGTGAGNVARIGAVTIPEITALAAAPGNGGGTAYVVATGGSGLLQLHTVEVGIAASIQIGGTAALSLGLDTDLHFGTGTGAAAPVVHLDALTPGGQGNQLSVQVNPPTNGVTDAFNLLVYEDNTLRETFVNLSRDSGNPRFIETIVNDSLTGSRLVRATNFPALPWQAPDSISFVFSGGDDANAADEDFVGDEAAGTGLYALDAVQDLSILIVPGRASVAVHSAMLQYCEVHREGSVFAVLDPPAALGATGILSYVTTDASLEGASEFGAIYWPRVKVLNPDKGIYGSSAQIVVPPSGIIAGVYARTDGARPGGVYDPPAGIEAGQLFGVLGFESKESLQERKRDLLYPHRINILTTGPGLPRFIDGARTLRGDGSFPYISERRGVLFIEQSLIQGLDFARHRVNTPELRAQVRRTITAFLLTQMRNGAFRSQEPAKAFYVDVSDELNPPSAVAAGVLNVRVGLATQKPAEFILLQISQDTRAFEGEIAGA